MKAAIPAVVSLLVLVSGPCAGFAQSAEAPEPRALDTPALATAERLVVRSGLAAQLKSYPRQMDEELSQVRGSLPEEVVEALRDAARIGFSAEGMQRQITQHLAAHMALADMQQALVWVESDAGQRMARAEEAASSSLSQQVLEDYFAVYQSNPPSERRAGLIVGLIEATRSVEHAAHAVESIALGVAVGMNATLPVQSQVGLAQLQAHLRTVMPPDELRAQMAGMLPVLFAYTYRGESDADLAQYLEFNRSPLGNRYNDAMMAAFIDALTRASVTMGPLIEQGMGRKKT